MKRGIITTCFAIILYFISGCNKQEQKTDLYTGIYRLDAPKVSPSIALYNNSTYELIEPSYSSYHNPVTDTYEVTGTQLMIRRGELTLYFRLDGNRLIYDKQKSSTSDLFRQYSPLEAGAEFEKAK